jgi:UDP-N-acetylmuramate: L-alanyl-gamma-D-glutamyl-meso-diaminopimelate ligase
MEYSKQKVHIIGIGEKTMLDLALALSDLGCVVTGSDESIPEALKEIGETLHLSIVASGWDKGNLSRDIDFVVIGSHIKGDNDELLEARAMDLKILSLPEYVFLHSQDKQRIVIAGTHGRNVIAAIVLHVLRYFKRDFDYVIATAQNGLKGRIKLSDEAPIIIIEGDEYQTSEIDPSPTFLHYHHHIGLVTGVAWDQLNVYPSYDEYVKQFDHFADSTPKAGILICSEADPVASMICQKERDDVQRIEYSAHKNEISNGKTYLLTDFGKVPLKIFGKNNMKNINGAKTICSKIGISDEMFYKAVESFDGTDSDTQILEDAAYTKVFKDIANTPAKLKAVTNAVKKQYPKRQLVAMLDLKFHSGTTRQYLSISADDIIIYYRNNGESGLGNVTHEEIKSAFHNKNLMVLDQKDMLERHLLALDWKNKNLLLLGSGEIEGINFTELAKKIILKDNYQKV